MGGEPPEAALLVKSYWLLGARHLPRGYQLSVQGYWGERRGYQLLVVG
jgi:hypothetical protein